MKKALLTKLMLLLCALIAGSSSVWATDVVCYSLDGTSTGGTSGYGTESDITQNNISWKVMGNTTQNPWRIGGNTLTNVNKTIYSTTAISYNIAKIEVTHGTASDITINSWTVIVSKNSDFSDPVSTLTPSFSASTTTTIERPAGKDWSDCYFKFVYNVSVSSSSNKFIQFSKADFYTPSIDPTITFNNGSVNVGKTLDLSTLLESNSSGEKTYTITSGDSYASISGSILTGVAAGSVTVQVSQAAAGVYNAKTATATITVNPALTLSSIAITTAPTKTNYIEGDIFDATGMVVTATYSNSNTEDVTALCTWTPNGALTTSDAEITVSYTENATTKTATQVITVIEQPTEVTANFSYTFFGLTADKGTTPNEYAQPDVANTSVTYNNVIFNAIKNDGTIVRYDANLMRLYNKNTLTITAPDGFAITGITLVSSGSDWSSGMNATPGTYDDERDANNKTYWTGASKSVSFTPGGTHKIASAIVSLAEAKNVTITAATWASFSSASALDFTNTDVTAYIAKSNGSTNSVTLTEIKKVPASTGIVVNAPAGTYAIPVLTGAADATTGNLLKPWLTAGTPGDATYYTLAVDGGNPIFKKSSGGTLAAGKAYLVMSGTSAPELCVDFGGTTNINSIENGKLKIENAEVYNLNGQRVANPTKGLYIVNGKKVIVK